MSFQETSHEAFSPVPANVNPFLALDRHYIEQLVQARSLCPEKRDPFSSERLSDE